MPMAVGAGSVGGWGFTVPHSLLVCMLGGVSLIKRDKLCSQTALGSKPGSTPR